jgi:hypothetical protein
MKKTTLVCRSEPTTFVITRILQKIKKLHPDDRCVLGDKLLRDNLKDLTAAFLAPILANTVSDPAKSDVADERRSSQIAQANKTSAQEAEEKGNFLFWSFIIQLIRGCNVGMVSLALYEFKSYVFSIPSWCYGNVPTAIMWGFYFTSLVILVLVGVPIVLVVIAAFLVKLPEKAPLQFELFLRGILPQSILYPKRYVG